MNLLECKPGNVYKCSSDLIAHTFTGGVTNLAQNASFLLIKHYPPDHRGETVMVEILGPNFHGSICFVNGKVDEFEFHEVC